jgi:flagellar hook-associated protein 2
VLTDNAESSFSVNVSQRGTMVWMKNQLDGLLGTGGVFESRSANAVTDAHALDNRISAMQDRLVDKEATLTRKFSALEAAMARIQSQSGSVVSQLQGMNAN